MRKLVFPLLLAAALLAAVFLLIAPARGQGPTGPNGETALKSETQDQNVRQVYAPPGDKAMDPQAPTIGFIDSPTSVCYQPDPSQDTCYINWYYLSVSASPNYMIAMTVTLNTIGTVARYNGFFQTSMYVPYNLQGQGFKVACGAPGAGEAGPNLGNAYAWTIRATDSNNLKSANYGTVHCPAFAP